MSARPTVLDDDIWQTLRQGVDGQLIVQRKDAWGWLHVVDQDNHRYLYFGAPYEQTCIHKYKPHQLVHAYARAMVLGFAFSQPDDVILLGLGGGSLLHALKKAFPDAAVTIVEMRQAVAEIARTCFQLDYLDENQLRIADARQEIRHFPDASCDLLLADMFFDDRMNPWQEQRKFYQQARRILRPNGWLVINFDRPRLVDTESCYPLADLFSVVLSLTTKDDNQVVLASSDAGFDLQQSVGQVEALGDQLEIPLVSLLKHVQEWC